MLSPAFAVDVIINNANNEQFSQAPNNLRAIFSMRTRYWPNGEKIRVFVLPDSHTLHKAFVKEKLQMFPHQLRRTWDRMTYTGTGQPPVTVDSIAEMLEKIKQSKYSIGYIDRRVDDAEIRLFDNQ
ncbi:MAG: hypothetical protein methR_P0355 [Methyloprofundus sp.]|nr:MAG: hypothetical protein methR_P0355 [Methyloprofundus sp.]